jgi:hypothetical protein
MMPLALGLLIAELYVLSRLLIRAGEDGRSHTRTLTAVAR